MAGGAKVLALIALLTLALGTTYAASTRVFSDADLAGVLVLGAAVNGVALLVLMGLPTRAFNAALAILAGLGIASAHVIHTGLFVTSPVLSSCLLVAAGAALFAAFGAMDRHPSVGLALAALGALATGMFLAEQAAAPATPASATAAPAPEVDMSNFRDVTFERRPNLYFVSFDAMAPRALLRKYMDVETTAFHEVFEPRFRRFRNFFVNAISTKMSLQAVLALDERWLSLAGSGQPTELEIFSGGSPGPLFRILRNNGYETHTAYESDFLGKTKGPHVDHYFTGSAHTLCDLVDPHVRAVSFWGYCSWVGKRPGRPGPAGYATAKRRVLAYLFGVSSRKGPQFVMAHLYAPAHTNLSFSYHDEGHLRAFSYHYVRRSIHAAHLLALLLNHLREHDPEAILLVYGDHGPFLSRNVAFADAPEFVVQDHYGALGGVHPPDACAHWFDEVQQRLGYLTLVDAAHVVIRCLSGGESALRVTPKEHAMVGGWLGVVPGGDLVRYSDFLYE